VTRLRGRNHKTITEYGAIGCGSKPIEDKFLCDSVDRRAFEALKQFNADNDDAIFTLTRAKTAEGRIDALRAKSYVGVIETKCGTVVEILPKILTHKDGSFKGEIKSTRAIFLKMLRFLRDSPFKEIDTAHLHTERHHILEVFISIFLADLARLIQKGIARDYVNREENQPFLKGKLLFNQNIKYNLTHKERFYVSYDEFLSDRPENRLIRSTLLFLAKKSRSNNNQKRIREFIFTLVEIPASKNIENDFSKVKSNRLVRHYEQVLRWCRVFLRNESFTNFRGKAVSLALLFPMERIFEDFVGAMFRKGNSEEYEISLQDRGKYLIEEHAKSRKFALRPDIVATNRGDEHTIILDAKWKLINRNKSKENYNISQGDFYQMFAYGKKYEQKPKELYLLYPESEDFNRPLKEFKFYKEGTLNLHACPVDIKSVLESKELSLDMLNGREKS